MSCTNQTSSATVALPAAAAAPWHRPAFVGAIVAIAEALREAIAMRRAMNRTHHLSDE
jgi:hypothetical protein